MSFALLPRADSITATPPATRINESAAVWGRPMHDGDSAPSLRSGQTTFHEPAVSHALSATIDALGTTGEAYGATRSRLDVRTLAAFLPSLGPVLWLHCAAPGKPVSRRISDCDGELLFAHPDLATLGCCDGVRAHFEVTARGPREWLAFHAADGGVLAKLFLLPDTDCLGWDHMLEGCAATEPRQSAYAWHSHEAFRQVAFARLRSGWQAAVRTFQFQYGLFASVLTLDHPFRVSALGQKLAQRIADDECALLAVD